MIELPEGSEACAAYLHEHRLHELVGLDADALGQLDRPDMSVKGIYDGVTQGDFFATQIADLLSLHYLATSRNAVTILEFGAGRSTVILADALQKNKQRDGGFVQANLRFSNPFECHSIEDDAEWIDQTRALFAEPPDHVIFHHSPCMISHFQGRLCTYYEHMPNVRPDLIYLDGPTLFAPTGSLRGLSTRHSDRMPMAGDILVMEHFLLPGTLIVVDGRTANARFLRANLQRNWRYTHSFERDQHYFELAEPPLGMLDQKRIIHCLGEEWLEDLDKENGGHGWD